MKFEYVYKYLKINKQALACNVEKRQNVHVFFRVYLEKKAQDFEIMDEIPLMRVLVKTELEEEECVKSRFNQLDLIEEKRMITLCYGQLYKKRLKREF